VLFRSMKRKLCVAVSLIGNPEVVLLDEPSAGLDPVSRRNLWSVILKTMSQRAVVLTTHSMEEAEALCKRIGIMVKGQLKALGTKQHLKTKFSSGYELTAKLIADDLAKQTIDLTEFVKISFPSAAIISENGGLITYRIPKEEMNVGLAFTIFEENKKALCIEDYSIAQPTLEQVFIRTVLAHTDQSHSVPGAGDVTVIGGTSRMSITGLNLVDEPNEGGELTVQKFNQERNCCGCTNYSMKIMAAIALALFVILVIIGIFVSPIVVSLGIISLIVSIVGCSMLYCSCCQPKKGLEE